VTLTYRKVPRTSCDFKVVSHDDATAAAALAHLHDVGHLSDLGSRSAQTWAAYRADWRHLSSCAVRDGLPSLPASPTTVALYLAGGAATFKVSTLRRG